MFVVRQKPFCNVCLKYAAYLMFIRNLLSNVYLKYVAYQEFSSNLLSNVCLKYVEFEQFIRNLLCNVCLKYVACQEFIKNLLYNVCQKYVTYQELSTHSGTEGTRTFMMHTFNELSTNVCLKFAFLGGSCEPKLQI